MTNGFDLERNAEILDDLEFVLREYGPRSEPWKMLMKELLEEEKRLAQLERQVLVHAMVERIDSAWAWPK